MGTFIPQELANGDFGGSKCALRGGVYNQEKGWRKKTESRFLCDCGAAAAFEMGGTELFEKQWGEEIFRPR